MSLLEIILIGIGLSMDAATVSITNGLANPKIKISKMLLIAIVFGLFQGLMPLIGYYAGSLFASFIGSVAPWIALVLLCFIGGKMIYECPKKKEELEEIKELSFSDLLLQGVATSIDAFAVGITFLGLKENGDLKYSIFLSVTIIAITTLLISFVSVLIGKKFGKIFKNKAEIIGGIILIVLGIKIFVEGIFF